MCFLIYIPMLFVVGGIGFVIMYKSLLYYVFDVYYYFLTVENIMKSKLLMDSFNNTVN